MPKIAAWLQARPPARVYANQAFHYDLWLRNSLHPFIAPPFDEAETLHPGDPYIYVIIAREDPLPDTLLVEAMGWQRKWQDPYAIIYTR
jgi:hypothetical protein